MLFGIFVLTLNHLMPEYVFEAIGIILLADFISGIVHWAEDAYIRRDTPFVGRWIGEANIEHHFKPRAFIKRSWWASSWDLVTVSTLVIVGSWWLNVLTWKIWLFSVLTANANQTHKWAHQSRVENGRLVAFFQQIRVLQTQRHHARHHTGQKDSNYCSITNFLNPFLEEINFWRCMEAVVLKVFGVSRKLDASVK